MRYQLPDLPFAVNALEPHLDAQTMAIHHGKHHAAYVAKLNEALETHKEIQEGCLATLLNDLSAVPEDIRTVVRNNGGGHFNHTFFWEILSPGNLQPSGELLKILGRRFGNFATFKTTFATAATTRFGSGWAWLLLGTDGRLQITSTPNQDNPLMKGVAEVYGMPILGLDVWEHAYYLRYQNRRLDYIAAFWNVVNWKKVEQNYIEAVKLTSAERENLSRKTEREVLNPL